MAARERQNITQQTKKMKEKVQEASSYILSQMQQFDLSFLFTNRLVLKALLRRQGDFVNKIKALCQMISTFLRLTNLLHAATRSTSFHLAQGAISFQDSPSLPLESTSSQVFLFFFFSSSANASFISLYISLIISPSLARIAVGCRAFWARHIASLPFRQVYGRS